VQAVALAVRFGLELCALAALAWWGFSVGDGVGSYSVGLGAPVAAAVVWGVLAAPKGRFEGRDPQRLAGEVVVFGAAVLALGGLGRWWLAAAFAVVAAVDGVVVRRGARDPSQAPFSSAP
jgi:Protein of unknown function (DUF2568)